MPPQSRLFLASVDVDSDVAAPRCRERERAEHLRVAPEVNFGIGYVVEFMARFTKPKSVPSLVPPMCAHAPLYNKRLQNERGVRANTQARAKRALGWRLTSAARLLRSWRGPPVRPAGSARSAPRTVLGKRTAGA